MNTLTFSINNNSWEEKVTTLNIYDTNSFNLFLHKLEEVDKERINAGMVEIGCQDIAKTLSNFSINFKEDYHDEIFVDDLETINKNVFNNKKTSLEVLLWLTNGMIELLQDMIEENKRYSGGIENLFLKDVIKLLIGSYFRCKSYVLIKE